MGSTVRKTKLKPEQHSARPVNSATSSTGPAWKTQEVTIIMADIRGFTTMSETHAPDVVVETLNRYLSKMSEVAVANGGVVDKFMGDAVMLLFGIPNAAPDDVQRALICAVQMQIAMKEMNRENKSLGLPALFMGVGINTGEVIAGTLGSALHSENTVIGNEVNVAARIESFSLRGQILISESTYARCADFVQVEEPMEVHMKGKTQPVTLREVLGIPSLSLQVPRQEIRKSPRVEVRLPFVYQSVKGKVVIPTEHKGLAHDLSYEGLLAEVSPDVMEHDEILVRMDLSLIGSDMQELYAKVRSIREVDQHRMAGIEFTTVKDDIERDLHRLVQLLMQGSSHK